MRRRTVVVGVAATAAATFVTLSHPSDAGEVAVWGESLDDSLNRVLRRRDLAVVIATHPAPDVLEVGEVLYGDVTAGQRLAFQDCEQLLIMGSTEDYLRQHVERAPVVDVPSRGVRSVKLSGAHAVQSYPPPGAEARFLIFLEYQVGADWWGFANQTLGDFYLLGETHVFRKTFLNEKDLDGIAWVRVFPEMTSQAFLDHIEARLAAERAGAGSAPKSIAP